MRFVSAALTASLLAAIVIGGCRQDYGEDLEPTDAAAPNAAAEADADADAASLPESGPPVACLTPQKPGNEATCICGAATGATQACALGQTGVASACRPGTQICGTAAGGIKRWSACVGATMPAAKETCFDAVDDDCDGVLNNGCACGDVPLCKGIDGKGAMLTGDALLLDKTTAKFGETVNALFVSQSPIGIGWIGFQPGGTCGGGGSVATCASSGCAGWNVDRRSFTVLTALFTQGVGTYTIEYRRGVTAGEQAACTGGPNTVSATLIITN